MRVFDAISVAAKLAPLFFRSILGLATVHQLIANITCCRPGAAERSSPLHRVMTEALSIPLAQFHYDLCRASPPDVLVRAYSVTHYLASSESLTHQSGSSDRLRGSASGEGCFSCFLDGIRPGGTELGVQKRSGVPTAVALPMRTTSGLAGNRA